MAEIALEWLLSDIVKEVDVGRERLDGISDTNHNFGEREVLS